MANLGYIKWGVQYTTNPPTENTAVTRTIAGLNLNENPTAAANTENANKTAALVNHLVALSLNSLNSMNLVRTQGVTDNG